jgi:hypothetical protein
VKSDVLTAVAMKIWDVTPHSVVESYQHFGGALVSPSPGQKSKLSVDIGRGRTETKREVKRSILQRTLPVKGPFVRGRMDRNREIKQNRSRLQGEST